MSGAAYDDDLLLEKRMHMVGLQKYGQRSLSKYVCLYVWDTDENTPEVSRQLIEQ